MKGQSRVSMQPGKYGVASEVLFHEVNGELVLLNLATGRYHGLNKIGTRIWQLICQHYDLEKIERALLNEYDVLEAQLRTDLAEFVERLQESGLLEPQDEEAG